MWTLTSSVEGVKDVLVIPAPLVPSLEPVVARGREYRSALTELLAINAQLVRLWRQQQSDRQSNTKRRKTARR